MKLRFMMLVFLIGLMAVSVLAVCNNNEVCDPDLGENTGNCPNDCDTSTVVSPIGEGEGEEAYSFSPPMDWVEDTGICASTEGTENSDIGFFAIMEGKVAEKIPRIWRFGKPYGKLKLEYGHDVAIISIPKKTSTDTDVVFKLDNEDVTFTRKGQTISQESHEVPNGINLYLADIGWTENYRYVRFCIWESEELKMQATCKGCVIEGRCIPIGHRVRTQYCDMDQKMVEQAGGGEICVSNYECESNICFDGQCADVGFMRKIIDWFKALFGV